MSTDPLHHRDPSPTRTRTPEQAAAWADVEHERARVRPQTRTVVDPIAVARLVIGVLMATAALTTYFVMAPDESDKQGVGSAIEYLDVVSAQQERRDDRRDALLVIGLVGAGAAVATSRLGRRTVEPPS